MHYAHANYAPYAHALIRPVLTFSPAYDWFILVDFWLRICSLLLSLIFFVFPFRISWWFICLRLSLSLSTPIYPALFAVSLQSITD